MAGKTTGRPRVELDLGLLAKLCRIQCTAEECAAVMGMSKSTLMRRLTEDIGEGFEDDDETIKGFEAFFIRHGVDGKVSIRRAQFKVAMGEPAHAAKEDMLATEAISPDKGMLIWLGKQYLDQRDRQEVGVGGTDGGPVEVAVTYRMTKAKAMK